MRECVAYAYKLVKCGCKEVRSQSDYYAIGDAALDAFDILEDWTMQAPVSPDVRRYLRRKISIARRDSLNQID